MNNRFSWALQKAVYARLSTDAALKDLVGDPPRIYDGAPVSTAFPYVTLGETRVRNWAGVSDGLEHDLRVHVFSRYQGRREVKQVLNAVYDALHDAPLALPGQRLVSLRFVFADVFPRRDGGVFEGVSRFRAMTHPDPLPSE